jgi:hypothetical protein
MCVCAAATILLPRSKASSLPDRSEPVQNRSLYRSKARPHHPDSRTAHRVHARGRCQSREGRSAGDAAARPRLVVLYVGLRDHDGTRSGDVWEILHDLFDVANPPADRDKPPCCEDNQPAIDDEQPDAFVSVRELQRGPLTGAS